MATTVAQEQRPDVPDQPALRVVTRSLSLGALVWIMFFTVSGGAYGLEDVVGSSGAGIGILLIVVTPLVWSLPSALMVAELATAMPVQGGYYYWVKRSLGPFWGFQEGWWSWLTTWVDMAIYPVLFVDYSAYYFEVFRDNSLARWLLGFGVIWFFTLLNIRGAKVVGDSSTLFGIIVLAPFAIMTVLGLLQMDQNPLSPATAPGEGVVGSLSLGLFVVMWNYYGWDGLSTVAGEMNDPKRDYPRTLLITVPLITLCYLLPVLVGLAVVGATDIVWQAGAWGDIAEAIGGNWLGAFITAAALVSAAGLFSALLLSVSRVPFVMGEDGYLPKVLFKTSKKYGTPWVALVVSSAIYSIFILGSFQDLVVVDVTVYSFALALEFVALLVFRKKYPTMKRPFKIPGGWPVVMLVCLLPMFVLGFAIYSQILDVGLFQAVGLAAIFLATGPILYPIAKYFKTRRGEEDVEIELEFDDPGEVRP
jgi:amino acid transporter